jgi:hypothetical protein
MCEEDDAEDREEKDGALRTTSMIATEGHAVRSLDMTKKLKGEER